MSFLESQKSPRINAADWYILRQKILRRDDWTCCNDTCEKPAKEVDHIIPKALGGTDEESNLQSLCFLCHQVKSRSDRRKIAARNSYDKQKQADKILGGK